MRYLLLLSSDFNRSVEAFTPEDLRANLEAAEVIAKCITTEYNPYEWDSSVRFDLEAWAGFEMQLFMYAFKMSERLGDEHYMELFEDLINAYSIDENSAMTRPSWTFLYSIIDAHRSYLMSVTSTPDHYTALFGRAYPGQLLPVPLPGALTTRA